ncbi:probable phosphoglycerate mutase [Pasteurella testudinis DSM 23072]|uniref:phosphoglycerate mutase (2,3-diphosphoglycerate-dependent) n=1 Tax=Pasteurella testudinis DSM 23072 TaxID=1122938 RepID=A0A1W1UZ94_9PAST|nr:histidine phosphatase family protein [Pasteurella testudinis]SMB86442.1 probable phosphoglycerate mutase [Pasteurella testudinis DSM 23072]SUB51799.1 protein GpmB [Pasteurella testudinis]
MDKQLCFYLIRHGRTEWNEAGLLQGGGDSPLTANGIAGAKATAAALQQIDFLAAYSSNLQRAVDTAALILEKRNIPQFQHAGLNEQFFGSWEGQKIAQLRQLAEYQTMSHDPANYLAQSNQGETYQSLYLRAWQAIRDIIQVHRHGNILIVSHGHTLRLLLHVLGGGDWRQHRDPQLSHAVLNTAINVVNYRQDDTCPTGAFDVKLLNDIRHLAPDSYRR